MLITDESKKDLFTTLSEDFAKAVREYRNARSESEIDEPMFMSEEKEEKKYEEYQARMKSLTTSKDYIKLTREEYWQQILKAKIEVIASIGGFKLMQEFHSYLYENASNRNDDLNLSSAFDYYADNIGGWCR